MGGNAHQQRKMRRAVQQILHSYGYSPNNKANDNGKKKLGLLDFLYKYLLPAVALAGFGHWIAQFSVIVASGAYVLALVLPFLGAWIWCDTRWKRIVLKIGAGLAALVFLWQDYHWIREEWTPSFLLLVPSHELIDCERRAFFVNHFGPKPLQDITIVIKDNSGGAVQQDDSYRTGIGLGPQDPDVPRYIWVKPLHPWDEDYTIKVSAAHFHSTQRVVLRSVAKHLEFAVEISTDDTKKPVLSCRDTLFPSSNPVAQGAHDICAAPMAENQAFLSRLQPSVYGVQDAAGSYTVVKFRTLSPPFDLDSQSDDRHLTEYQKTVMKYKLSKYSGAKLLVLYAGGSKTLSYANELADFFHSLEWKIEGPRLVPIGNERMIDVQISVSKQYWNVSNPRAIDLLNSLEGIKHRARYVYDEAIPLDLIVLWVGPKSPTNFRPDDCAPAELNPRPGEHHTCELVAQTPSICMFPPQ